MSTTAQTLINILKAHGWVYDGDKGAYLSPGRVVSLDSTTLAQLASEEEGEEVLRHLAESTGQYEEEEDRPFREAEEESRE